MARFPTPAAAKQPTTTPADLLKVKKLLDSITGVSSDKIANLKAMLDAMAKRRAPELDLVVGPILFFASREGDARKALLELIKDNIALKSENTALKKELAAAKAGNVAPCAPCAPEKKAGEKPLSPHRRAALRKEQEEAAKKMEESAPKELIKPTPSPSDEGIASGLVKNDRLSRLIEQNEQLKLELSQMRAHSAELSRRYDSVLSKCAIKPQDPPSSHDELNGVELLPNPPPRTPFGVTAIEKPTMIVGEQRGTNLAKMAAINPRQTLNGQYTVLAKSGSGNFSNAWYCDTHASASPSTDYLHSTGTSRLDRVVVKVQVAGNEDWIKQIRPGDADEITVMQDLAAKAAGELKNVAGRENILHLRDAFEITSPVGTHICLAFEPLGVSVAEWKAKQPARRLSEWQLQCVARKLLPAVDWLHRAGYIHGDINPSNVLLRPADPQEVFRRYENALREFPVKFKRMDGRMFWQATPLPHPSLDEEVEPVLSDFGASVKMGWRSDGVIAQQWQYAPEVLLGCGWGWASDTWELGLLFLNLLADEHGYETIRCYDNDDKYYRDLHVASLVSLLGSPPSDMLDAANEEVRNRYFDQEGSYHGPVELWEDSVESRLQNVHPSHRDELVSFLKGMLRWSPVDRQWSSLFCHRWLVNEVEYTEWDE